MKEKIITKAETDVRKKEILEKIEEGAVFIHPTDTIYGLGCKATDEEAVNKIRELKEREDNPFSIWIPNKDWIWNKCDVTKGMKDWLDKLPGPYTIITELEDKQAVAPNVNPEDDKTLGIRLPNHWFSEIVEEVGEPIITTSVNKTGEQYMTNKDNADEKIKNAVEFIIYEGEKQGSPSKLIDLTKDEEEIKERN